MKKITLISASALALISFNPQVLAQESSPSTPPPVFHPHPMMNGPMMDRPLMHSQGMPPMDMPHNMYRPDFKRPAMPPQFTSEFPSPEELSRMAPPEPMTEEKIKQRFAKQKADLQANLERDRKAAEKYARDFARLQKFQADRLAEIMADAEKRREKLLERLEQREQQVLEQFRQRQAPETPAAEKEET